MKLLSRLAWVLVLAGCSDAVSHTDLCRKVYSALCDRGKECGTIRSQPACQAWYYESCRVRRLNEGIVEPDERAVQECLVALAELDCGDLDLEKLLSGGSICAFLRLPQADAGVGDSASGPDDEPTSGADSAVSSGEPVVPDGGA